MNRSSMLISLMNCMIACALVARAKGDDRGPPTLYLKKDSPPTLLLYGSADLLAAQGDEFLKRPKELGHRAELFTAEGQKHGFFNRPPWLEKTTQRLDEFLVSIGYLQAEPTGKP